MYTSTPHKKFCTEEHGPNNDKGSKIYLELLYILALKASFNSAARIAQPISRLEEAYTSEETNNHLANAVLGCF